MSITVQQSLLLTALPVKKTVHVSSPTCLCTFLSGDGMTFRSCRACIALNDPSFKPGSEPAYPGWFGDFVFKLG